MRSGSASARPSALPASATSSSAAPGSTSSARSKPAYCDEPFEQPVEDRQPGRHVRRAAAAQLHLDFAASRCRHRCEQEATEDGPFGPCARPAEPADTRSQMAWLAAMLAGDRAAADASPWSTPAPTFECLSSPRARPLVYDVRSRGRDVRDLNGHGTRVAELIAREDPGARLMIIRAGSSSGAFSDVERSHGDPLRRRPRRADRQPQPRRRRARRPSSARPCGTRSREARSSSPQPATTMRAGPSIRRRCSARTGSRSRPSLRDGAHAPFSNTGPWVSIAAPARKARRSRRRSSSAAAAESGLRTRGSRRARSSRSCRRPRPATAFARTSSASASSTSRAAIAAHARLRLR